MDNKNVVHLISQKDQISAQCLDIDAIIDDVFQRENVDSEYVKNRVLFDADGSLITEHVAMNIDEVAEMVESNIEFAITHYGLIASGETVSRTIPRIQGFLPRLCKQGSS